MSEVSDTSDKEPRIIFSESELSCVPSVHLPFVFTSRIRPSTWRDNITHHTHQSRPTSFEAVFYATTSPRHRITMQGRSQLQEVVFGRYENFLGCIKL